MTYTPEVQQLVDDPFGGRTAEEVRELCESPQAQLALMHPPQPFLIEKFSRDHGFDFADSLALFEEVKRFLVAGEVTGQSLAPSLHVDNMWHAWILFTHDYHDFCGILGGYIHHRPIPKGDGAQPPLEPTVAIMEAAFGTLSDRFWPQELGSYGVMDCKKGV